jgi:hypothetical protein
MELKSWQLITLVVGAFVAVIAADVFINYKDEMDFANGFPKLNTAMFSKSRVKQMIEQEHNVVPVGNTAPPTFAEEEEETSED